MALSLSRYLKREDLSPTAFARLVGVRQSTIWRLLHLPRTPTLDVATRIERVTTGAVPASVWTKGRKRRFSR
jgi:plasmid maintenance system antidote protein VapI